MTKQLDQLLATVDPATLHALDAVAVLEAAAEVERKAGALKTLVADRAADAGSWAREGYRSPEAWLAQKNGCSFGEAAGTLEASAKLAELPETSAAVRNGEVSAAQLRQLAPAATPENEKRLLSSAQRDSFKDLQRSCAQEKARTRSAEQERARQARIHMERFHRSWTNDEGAYCYEGKTTAAVGARIEAALSAEADNVFKAAYAEGRRESGAAYRADALENLICGGGAKVDTQVVIRVDAERLAGGEGVCETPTGPVSVDEAIGAILADAFVTVVVRDGVDISTVARPGRHRPALLESAVFERDDYRCVRPGCGATQHLEVHHWRVDYGKRGPTAYWNLATLCSHDHDLVTHGGHKLDGGPGRWSWVPPP
ncbi:MAG: DUF222 domain-containing protein [Actinobacteria bacterium]|nr:DUF222 domain-containing protein [Actinomycetota bacterium]